MKGASMADSHEMIESFINAPTRLFRWRILSAHPGIWSEESIARLKECRDNASGDGNFTRVQQLSHTILRLERCRALGADRACWGAPLDEERRHILDVEIPPNLAACLRMADDFAASNRWEGAIQKLNEVLTRDGESLGMVLKADLQGKLGIYLRDSTGGNRVENLERAIGLFEDTLEAFARASFPTACATIQRDMGRAWWKLIRGDRGENLERALELFESAGAVFTKETFQEEWAEIQNDLALTYWSRIRGDHADNLEMAIELYRAALGIWNPVHFPSQWATAQNNMGNAYLRRIRGDRAENLEKTIECYISALEVRTRDIFPEDWASTRNNLGIAYSVRIHGDRAENLERSIEHYDSALEVRTRETNPEYWAQSRNNQANTYERRILGDRAENLEKAIGLRMSALEVWTREDYPEYWAQTNNNLAIEYNKRIRGDRAENLERSIECYRAALEIHGRQSFPLYWAHDHRNLGMSYLERISGNREENLDRAVECFESALEVFTAEAFPLFQAMTLCNVADACRLRDDGSCGENLRKAIGHYASALQVYSPEVFPRLCRETAIALAETQSTLALWKDALASTELARKADRIRQRQATTVTGKAHEIEEGATLYHLASFASAHLGDIAGAAAWLEQGRTRELGEAMSMNRALFDRELRDEDRQAYGRLIERLRALEAEQRGAMPGARPFLDVVAEAETVHEGLEGLIGEIQEYAPGFLQEAIITKKEIERLIDDERTAFVLYNVTRFGTSVILLARIDGRPRYEQFFLENFSTEILREIADEWADTLNRIKTEALNDEIHDTCRRLYEDLFSPVHRWLEDEGKRIENIVFVPHLALHNLPLHLMQYRGNGRSRYLIEDYEISYAPSLTMILEQKGIRERKDRRPDHEREAGNARPGKKKLLLVANPTKNLDSSEDEAEYIGEIFPGRCRILLGGEATRERFRHDSRTADILHLSCHGLFDRRNPWESGLVLACESTDWSVKDEKPEKSIRTTDEEGNILYEFQSFRGGSEESISYDRKGNVNTRVRSLPGGRKFLVGEGELLTLKEIVTHLDLRDTDLVVLSACETGLVGFGGKADEFVGLPGGFLRAGVPVVVASLWAVDDTSTASLMAGFYHGLVKEELSPARALRQAQLKFISRDYWRDRPYYWGAFRVLGE